MRPNFNCYFPVNFTLTDGATVTARRSRYFSNIYCTPAARTQSDVTYRSRINYSKIALTVKRRWTARRATLRRKLRMLNRHLLRYAPTTSLSFPYVIITAFSYFSQLNPAPVIFLFPAMGNLAGRDAKHILPQMSFALVNGARPFIRSFAKLLYLLLLTVTDGAIVTARGSRLSSGS